MNPGSQEAVEAGCRCPRIDNHYGKGYHGMSGSYVISERCPIHSLNDTSQPAREDKT